MGVGPGNWKLKLGDYVQGYGFNEKQINWTRPHNDFLWILAEKGYVGLISFLGILICAMFYAIRVLTRSGNKNEQILSMLILSGLIGYIVVAFFDFPGERIDHQVLLGLYIGIISSIYVSMKSQESKSMSFPFFFISFLLVFVFIVFSTVYSYSAFRQEQKVYQLREAKASKNWRKMLDISKDLSFTFRNLDPEALPFHYYPGFAYLQLNDLKNARIQYEKALTEHPNNIQVLNDLGVVNIKSERIDEAKVFFEKALYIVPDYTSALKNLSSYFGVKGDYQKSYEIALRIPENLRDKEVQERIKFLGNALKSKK
jgi:tetratricopeptide (TPR) repeat protein